MIASLYQHAILNTLRNPGTLAQNMIPQFQKAGSVLNPGGNRTGATPPISRGPQKLGAGTIGLKPSYESPKQSYQPAGQADAVIRYKQLLGS